MSELVSAPEADPDLANEVGQLAREILAGTDDADGTGLDRAAWDALHGAGLTELLRPADAGGAGAGWPEAAALLAEVGAAAARVPVVEHDVLAGWLLRRAGLDESGAGMIRTAGLWHEGSATAVPWAREATSVVLLGADPRGVWRVAEVAAGSFETVAGENLAGEPRDAVLAPEGLADGVAVGSELVDEFRMRLALARSVMIGGATARALELVLEHVGAREQFGRPLARFQAVQHLVASIAAESGLIRAAAAGAVAAAGNGDIDDRATRIAVLAAASCAAHGSSVVARGAHQLLGAMGYTLEHPLHRCTNRILSWRSEAGSTRDIDAALLREVAGTDPDQLWPLLLGPGVEDLTKEHIHDR